MHSAMGRWLMQMPHAYVIRLPDSCTRGIPLIHCIGIAVVQIDVGIAGAWERTHFHPGHQFAGSGVILLNFVVKFCGAVRGSKENIVKVGLSLGQIVVGCADQHREVGQVWGDLGGIDGDSLAVGPAIVEGVSASARCFLNSHGVECCRGPLVIVLCLNPRGGAGNLGDADFVDNAVSQSVYCLVNFRADIKIKSAWINGSIQRYCLIYFQRVIHIYFYACTIISSEYMIPSVWRKCICRWIISSVKMKYEFLIPSAKVWIRICQFKPFIGRPVISIIWIS